MLNWWLPENVSTYGRDIDWLFHLIYWITGITFILVAVTMIAFIVIYRDRPGRRARYTHGSTPLEIAWTIVPCIILAIIAIPTLTTIASATATPTGPNVVQVKVVGHQF